MDCDWKRVHNAMENATGTVAFCPMIAILFVGTRIRALRLTNNRGAPQGWVQDGMFCATWAILIQFLMVLLVPLAVYLMEGEVTHPEVDKDYKKANFGTRYKCNPFGGSS